ncbi:MAG: hypothetical protein Q4B96_02575 [Bacillota bacterium]|nr:hypothetical protein [Bacillota bacterium]
MSDEKKPVERRFVDASQEKEVKKSAETAAAEQQANEEAKKEKRKTTDSKPEYKPAAKGKAGTLRLIAVILWVAAIGFEILTILLLNGTLYLPGNELVWLCAGIGIDLICIVIGSLLWKKANRIDPASEKDKLKFFLWNNLGVIAAIIAFLPLIVILLKNKELDKKTKKIVTVVAVCALVLAGALSFDYDPVSEEDLAEAKSAAATLGDGSAYWTRWGKSYHLDPDCHTLMRSEVVYQGSVEEAFEASRTDPCDFCAEELTEAVE